MSGFTEALTVKPGTGESVAALQVVLRTQHLKCALNTAIALLCLRIAVAQNIYVPIAAFFVLSVGVDFRTHRSCAAALVFRHFLRDEPGKFVGQESSELTPMIGEPIQEVKE
jgi:hypothetical protein